MRLHEVCSCLGTQSRQQPRWLWRGTSRKAPKKRRQLTLTLKEELYCIYTAKDRGQFNVEKKLGLWTHRGLAKANWRNSGREETGMKPQRGTGKIVAPKNILAVETNNKHYCIDVHQTVKLALAHTPHHVFNSYLHHHRVADFIYVPRIHGILLDNP